MSLEWVVQVVEILVPLALGVSRWGLGSWVPLHPPAPAVAASSLYSNAPCRILVFYMLHDVEKVRKFCPISEKVEELEFEPRCV